MSGHSKWNNIKRKKEKADGAKAKIFTKIGREIAIAVREGGSADPGSNSRLRDAIAKAKANNVPNDNIKRAIDKASSDTAAYEKIVYEGYGAGGIAVIVETLTDNRNRTAATVRHLFDKYGGNLGTSGCVSFMFTQKGVIVLENEDGFDSDALFEQVMEIDGVDDLDVEETAAEITTAPFELVKVCEALEQLGYHFTSAEVAYVPSSYTALSNPDQLKQMGTMLELLEEDDDIQGVWHNLENEEDLP
ncbi:MAG: YebC/PmpR family DNA-binding transcriptional regulator [Oscillospiraceae bacterium]|nr:YebC/PmpR family DNA-binding transcriptional regulator [Oscillospiraceae bacterium]